MSIGFHRGPRELRVYFTQVSLTRQAGSVTPSLVFTAQIILITRVQNHAASAGRSLMGLEAIFAS
jgi:hypothetical protein